MFQVPTCLLLLSVVSGHPMESTLFKNTIQTEKQPFETENALETLLSLDSEEKCYGRRCVHSNHCCPGSVCVDINQIAGTCLPLYGLSTENYCKQDEDCKNGEYCQTISRLPALEDNLKTCQLDLGNNLRRKQFNDQCVTSNECDSSRGLCCQLIKRYRLSPKKLCYYFVDPKACLGPVDMTHVKQFHSSYPSFQKALFTARFG